MINLKNVTLAAITLSLTTPALADSKVVVQPVQLSNESIRYNHSRATVDQFSDTGSVQVQAAASIAAAGVGIAAVQNRLDQTLDALGSQIVQLTTVDPDDSYAGQIVFEKVRFAKLPMQVMVAVEWNGRRYPFAFQIAKPGTQAPAFTPPVIEAADVPASAPTVAKEAVPAASVSTAPSGTATSI